MYEVNVIGTLHVHRPCAQAHRERAMARSWCSPSTAGFVASRAAAGTSPPSTESTRSPRPCAFELCGQPVRVIEIAPGMVRTDEFALNRYGGDA